MKAVADAAVQPYVDVVNGPAREEAACQGRRRRNARVVAGGESGLPIE